MAWELPETIGVLKSSPVVTRHPANPVLSARDVPYPATLVYNAGVCKYRGKYVMVFRNDVYPPDRQRPGCLTEINLGLATSDDGIRWEVAPSPCFKWTDDEGNPEPLDSDEIASWIETRDTREIGKAVDINSLDFAKVNSLLGDL